MSHLVRLSLDDGCGGTYWKSEPWEVRSTGGTGSVRPQGGPSSSANGDPREKRNDQVVVAEPVLQRTREALRDEWVRFP